MQVELVSDALKRPFRSLGVWRKTQALSPCEKNQIAPKNEGDLKKDEVEKIANTLDVSEDEVVSMNRRLSGKEQSLNAPIGEDVSYHNQGSKPARSHESFAGNARRKEQTRWDSGYERRRSSLLRAQR